MAYFNKITLFDDMFYVIDDDQIKILKANKVVSLTKGAPQMVEKHQLEWTADDKKKTNLDNVSSDILYKS